MVDLGCGHATGKGFLGVDNDPAVNPDIVADITKPVPGLEDGCAEFVICRHVLEHLPYNSYFDVLMEIARLLKPGGTFDILVPHPAHENAMIHGHNFILTPYWWRQLRDYNWLNSKLIIDSIEEMPEGKAIEAGLFNADVDPVIAKLRPFLWNAYYQTIIRGHKP
jgi:predicted SAM-dependent methyltransferase